MNTHIKTWLGTTIIIIMAITAGIFIWKVYEMNTAYAPALQTFQTPKSKVKENNVGIANPASVFCEQNGGKLEIITATDGSQGGMCKFSDGSECEEWAFQRGECKIGDSQKQVDTSDWKTYRNEKYGFEFKYPSFLKQAENKGNNNEEAGALINLDGKDDNGSSIRVYLFDDIEKYRLRDVPGGDTFYFDNNTNNWYYLIDGGKKIVSEKDYGPKKLNFSQEAYKYSSGDAGWSTNTIILPILNRKKVLEFNVTNWVYGFSIGETKESVDFNAIISTLKFTK